MTEGDTTKLLIKFSIPMLIGNLFQQIYNLVDSVVVGQYVGSNALAAIGASGSVVFLFIALCNGIASGGGIVVAQRFGVWGIWWSAGLVWFVSAVFCMWRYLSYGKNVLGKMEKSTENG